MPSHATLCPAAGHPCQDKGVILIEALVSILLLSIAMLGMAALYANAVHYSSDAEYRHEAAHIINELVATMRADLRDPTSLANNYGSPTGPSYQSWLDDLIQNNRLPGLESQSPVLQIRTIDGVSPPYTARVELVATLHWVTPQTQVRHTYEVTTIISQ